MDADASGRSILVDIDDVKGSVAGGGMRRVENTWYLDGNDGRRIFDDLGRLSERRREGTRDRSLSRPGILIRDPCRSRSEARYFITTSSTTMGGRRGRVNLGRTAKCHHPTTLRVETLTGRIMM